MKMELQSKRLWRRYSDLDGLLYSSHCLTKGIDGHMWIGTMWGLSRCDGDRFVNFTTQDGLPTPRIYAMCTDRNGHLWLGTHCGLVRFDGTTFAAIGPERGHMSPILALCMDGHGNIWAGGTRRLAMFDGSVLHEVTGIPGTATATITGICRSRDGGIWVSSDKLGLWHYDGRRWMLKPEELYGFGAYATGVFEDSKGNLWLPLFRNGLVCLDTRDNVVFNESHGHGSLGILNVLCVYEDKNGRIWIGTEGQGVFCRNEQGEWSQFTVEDGLTSLHVSSVFQDNDGVLWFACQHGGVCSYDFHHAEIFTDSKINHSMGYDSQGNLWWGNEKDLCVLRDGRGIETFAMSYKIMEVFEDSAGRFWVGTEGDGLWMYESPGAVAAGAVPVRIGIPQGLAGDKVWRVFEDSRKRLWIGTNKGVSSIENGTVRGFADLPVPVTSGVVLDFCETRNGEVYFGGWQHKDLNKFANGGLEIFAASDDPDVERVMCLATGPGDAIWIGRSHGLDVWKQGVSRRFAVHDGFFGAVVQCMLCDSRGQMWIGTLGSGICRYDGTNFQILTTDDGLPSNTIHCIREAADGSMTIGTDRGICRYVPDLESAPSVVIDSVDTGTLHKNPTEVSTDYYVRAVRIKFSGHSSRTRKIRFNYMLEGYDPVWRSTWADEVVYTNLPPGQYTFRLKAVSRDFVDSPEASFTLSPKAIDSNPVVSDLEEAARRRTHQLDRAKRYHENIIQALNDALIVCDMNGIIRSANRAACELLSYDLAELAGRHAGAIVENADSIFSAVAAESRNRVIPVTQQTLVARDGRKILVLLSLSVARQEEGLTEIACIAHNISDRVRAEQELRDLNIKLSRTLEELTHTQQIMLRTEKLQAMGQMASGVAHDFNNVLVPIVGYSAMLLEDPALLDNRPETLDILQTIHAAGVTATETVKSLQQFYRTSDEEASEWVDVEDMIKACVNLLRPRWREEMLACGIRIDVNRVVKENFFVRVNPTKMRQSIINLLNNSIDALPAGGVIAITSAVKDGKGIVEVADNGTGMSEETRRRCQDPFFTTKGSKRAGLGLSTVYGFVTRAGGTFDIESRQDGAGTRVRMILPCAMPRPPAAAAAAAAPVRKTAGGLSILCVDDEEIVRQLFVKILSNAGHKAQAASGGRDGIEKFKSSHYDVVLLDRAMPDMRGDEVAAVIKAERRDVPIIMVTGFGSIMTAAGDLPACVDMVLSKPVSSAALLKAVQKVAVTK